VTVSPPTAALARIAVLLVDDHPVVRDGYRHLLESTSDIGVAGEAADGESACARYAELRPDVVILDLSMPGIGGLETIRRLKTLDPSARILAFTMHDSEAMILRTLEAGAAGYLTKASGMGQMVEAVRKVARGKPHIDSLHVTDLVRNALSGTSSSPLQALSAREFQLFQCFAEGQTVAQIAAALRISPKTVAVHHANINKKLDLRTTAQLVRLAIRCNIVGP
jgi:two-component system, NarL family, invasion response regulator UvrY